MQILAFRIKNFRSIVDTGWVNLAADNVMALVGQNESGKTAVLDALAGTFSSGSWHTDDSRYGAPLPEAWIRVSYTDEEISKAVEAVSSPRAGDQLRSFMRESKNQLTWYFPSEPKNGEPLVLEISFISESPDLLSKLEAWLEQEQTSQSSDAASARLTEVSTTDASAGADTISEAANASSDFVTEFTDELFRNQSPTFVAFKEESGVLPDRVEITEEFKLSGPGATAARNFLTIAQVNLKALVQSDTKSRAAILKRANRVVTEGFLSFWRQTIGKKGSIELECDIHHYPTGHEKVGKAYLEFLIGDSAGPLYPKQRSRGTRWFISFYLQLQASATSKGNSIFLLDEPGANLHEKAQADVLALIEKLRHSVGVIYSTHSPHLISYQALHRILAVERDSDHPAHPTRVIGAHALGAASVDTLSPILSTMGAALSRQTAIKQHNNVILEELSSFYYLKAFWLLTDEKQEVHFLAATGTSNVPQLANLFLGWGLEFVVVVDDEPSGRQVYNSLKRDMFLDNHAWAAQRMYKLAGCEGVEDLFDITDYMAHVLGTDKEIKGGNSRWAKANGAAKAIHALNFLKKVENGTLTLSILKDSSQTQIQRTVKEIASRLENYRTGPVD